MIQQPIEMTFSDQKFSMIIYAPPGMGKTTLALSAPDPILIDFDRGVSRVKAYHRCPTITCSNYEEILKDIETPEVQNCRSIIIDTGGSFVGYLQDWAVRNNSGSRKRDGTISIQGFGVVKREFERFTSNLRDVMNKNVIYVFHSDEQKDNDGNIMQRLQCEGASKNMVWRPCDFGGFMRMANGVRTITFTPSAEFFAKGCHGIEGTRIIPTLKPTDKNDFLTKLFEEARSNITAENEAFIPLKEQYEAAMTEVRKIVDEVKTVEDANAAVTSLPAIGHALASENEARAMLTAKAKELGFVWDKTKKAYKKAK